MHIRKSFRERNEYFLFDFAAPTGYYNEPGCEGVVASLQVYIFGSIIIC